MRVRVVVVVGVAVRMTVVVVVAMRVIVTGTVPVVVGVPMGVVVPAGMRMIMGPHGVNVVVPALGMCMRVALRAVVVAVISGGLAVAVVVAAAGSTAAVAVVVAAPGSASAVAVVVAAGSSPTVVAVAVVTVVMIMALIRWCDPEERKYSVLERAHGVRDDSAGAVVVVPMIVIVVAVVIVIVVVVVMTVVAAVVVVVSTVMVVVPPVAVAVVVVGVRRGYRAQTADAAGALLGRRDAPALGAGVHRLAFGEPVLGSGRIRGYRPGDPPAFPHRRDGLRGIDPLRPAG